MSSAVAVIPARIKSSRLPRKPLVDIGGVPMILHVWARCCESKLLDDVYVATDSEEIGEVVSGAGGKVIMTSPDHETGTDRIAEAASKLDAEIIVNVQGDEALVDPEHIDKVLGAFKDTPEADAAILVCPFNRRGSPSDIKAVLNEQGYVMYFSRSDIPSDARTPGAPMLKAYHVVPFRREFLATYSSWPKGQLESVEFNEYLRILEKGRRIFAVRVESSAISVDTPEDLEFVREVMKTDPIYKKYKNRLVK